MGKWEISISRTLEIYGGLFEERKGFLQSNAVKPGYQESKAVKKGLPLQEDSAYI